MHISLLQRTSSTLLQFCGAVSWWKSALRCAIHIAKTFLLHNPSTFTHAQDSCYSSTHISPGSLGLG